MPFPRSQLNIIICSKDPDWQPTRAAEEEMKKSLNLLGISTQSELDQRSHQWVVGGFRRLHMLRHRFPTLVANHQGGYRVFCSHCQVVVTGLFVRAIQSYRSGGDRSLQCAKCGTRQDLNSLKFQPHAAFVCYEVQLNDVQSSDLTKQAYAFFERHIPEMQLILKRQG